jgi:hypothetical protein
MELKYSNLGRPSNKKWKKVADYFLYTLPLYSVAIAITSDKLWGPEIALYITTAINVIIVTLKGLTKFTSEPVPGEVTDPVVTPDVVVEETT